MAQYNLINSSIFRTVVSGSFNKSLSAADLFLLSDNNTTTSGVNLSSSEYLCLEVDLGQRIQIDDIRLYADDLTKQSSIDIQFKNLESDSYSGATKSVSTYYRGTLPEPSAPRYIRCTVSGLNIELFELQVNSDDFIVGFGSDGNESAIWMEDTPIGSEGAVQSIEIYNNRTSGVPANAYVCIDYTGDSTDYYLKIANSATGTFVGVEAGTIMGHAVGDWALGDYVNTHYESSDTSIRLTDTATGSGTYTSHEIALDSEFDASYFIVKADTEVGAGTVTTDADLFDGTIEIRSSTKSFKPIDEIYWPYTSSSSQGKIAKYTVGSDTFVVDSSDYLPNVSEVHAFAVDRRTGDKLVCAFLNSTYPNNWYLLDRAGSLIKTISISSTEANGWLFPAHFDSNGGFWCVTEFPKILHYSTNGVSLQGSLTVAGIIDLCSELNGQGAWYVDAQEKVLIKLDIDCTILYTVYVDDPIGVCGTEDNGCWVINNSDPVLGAVVEHYNEWAELVTTINMPADMEFITHDHSGGFYVRSATSKLYIYHYNSSGNLLFRYKPVEHFDQFSAGKYGLALSSTVNKIAAYLELETLTIVWRKDYLQDIYSGADANTGCPAMFSWDSESERDYWEDYGSKLLPVSYDPVWYGESNLPYQEVAKDGYFLPKVKYHQVRLTLRNYDGTSTPVVKGVIMAPAVRITDIRPLTSKPVYLRTDIPATATNSVIDSKLKVWWDIEE